MRGEEAVDWKDVGGNWSERSDDPYEMAKNVYRLLHSYWLSYASDNTWCQLGVVFVIVVFLLLLVVVAVAVVVFQIIFTVFNKFFY